MAAIYQWFTGQDVIVTTTMYPLEASEAVELSLTIDSARLSEIGRDNEDLTYDMVTVTRDTILLAYGPDEDEEDLSYAMVDVTRQTVLLNWTGGPDEEDLSYSMVDVTREDKLITIYSPDEGLILSCDLDPANCSMTSV